MSVLGQKQTLQHVCTMSALPPKADMDQHGRDVRFVPKADIISVWTLRTPIASAACHIRRDPPRQTVLRLFGPKHPTFSISYNWRMDGGQVSILVAVACFAALVVFMVCRKPRA